MGANKKFIPPDASQRKDTAPHDPFRPSAGGGQRIDLPIREIRQLFESFKGIRISNHLAYQIQEALIRGEGEQVGPVLDVCGVKTRFAINGLPSLTSLRRAILYKSLVKSRQKNGLIDLGHTARFFKLTQKGSLTPIDQLKRRLLLEGISISPDGRDLRVRGGLNFEELSFDFDAPEDGLDIAEYGRNLLIAIYEFHDCSVGATALFFHTNEQLMLGILKRAGVQFDTPDALHHFQLSPELEKQFGPIIRQQLIERLQIPMTEILRTAKARAAKKKLANRRFLEDMEERIKNYINLVMVPEFGPSVLNDDNAASLHACAWHFLQWEIGQLPVEDILNLEVVSPYEMMYSRIARRLGVTEHGCPAFFNKDYTTQLEKPYAPIIITQETLRLIFRYFKTADLLESSYHESMVSSDASDLDPKRTLLEIELKHVQRMPFEIRRDEIENRLQTVLAKLASPQEMHGVLSVEVKQVLASLQEILELPVVHFFGVAPTDTGTIYGAVHNTVEVIQTFLKPPAGTVESFEKTATLYLSSIDALNTLISVFQTVSREDRRLINTWASLSEIYRLTYNVKGLDPPTSRRKRTVPVKHEGFPMLRFGPEMEEVPADRLVRATFVFPSDRFTKLNLIPPHLRTFFIIDEPDNHMGQYHLAAWAFRIHWKRRRLGHGQKKVADDYIRSLRFMRCFVYRHDKKDVPYFMFCNVDSEVFGTAKLAVGGVLIEEARRIARDAFGVPINHIFEVNQADEPANEHDRLVFLLDHIAKAKSP